MGLDMYLTKKIYLGAQYEHNDTNVKLKITRDGKEIKLSPKISKLEYEVGYWRKANQIHKWFVDNIQDGNDNCEAYEVSEEKLKELRNLCQFVIDNSVLVTGKISAGFTYEKGKETPYYVDGLVIEDIEYAEQNLPTESGFFFGATGYDEYYIQDLKHTIEIIDTALSEAKESEGSRLYTEFYYQSSW